MLGKLKYYRETKKVNELSSCNHGNLLAGGVINSAVNIDRRIFLELTRKNRETERMAMWKSSSSVKWLFLALPVETKTHQTGIPVKMKIRHEKHKKKRENRIKKTGRSSQKYYYRVILYIEKMEGSF